MVLAIPSANRAMAPSSALTLLLKSFVGADEKGSPCWAPHVASDTRRWHTSLVWRRECLELPQEQTFPSAALMSQNDPKRKSISGHSVRPTFGNALNLGRDYGGDHSISTFAQNRSNDRHDLFKARGASYQVVFPTWRFQLVQLPQSPATAAAPSPARDPALRKARASSRAPHRAGGRPH
jgi:hypothetical protein